MNRLTEKIFADSPTRHFTSHDVSAMFPESENTRYGLVKRAIANGEIIHIRRGLYCLAPKYQKKSMNLYELAQHIYGPSYISLESALSRHGWIPEAVYTTTSVSLGKSKEFGTPLGVFSYSRVPQKVFYTGVERVTDETGDAFLMATPLKALSDYVYVNRKDWISLEPLTRSLRVEPEELENLDSGAFEALIDNYSSRRVQVFLESLKKDLE